ncbi:MAG: hypothetical protein ABEJ72_05535, partial [Candidatus Aenigmatarchaeota archaeon]
LEINAIFGGGQWASPYLLVEEISNGIMVNSRLQNVPGLDDTGKIVIEDQESFREGLSKHIEEHYEEESLIFFTEGGTLKWEQGECEEKVPGATYETDPEDQSRLQLDYTMDRFVLGEKKLDKHLAIPFQEIKKEIDNSLMRDIKIRVSENEVFLNLSSGMNLHSRVEDWIIPPRDYIDDPNMLLGRPLKARGEVSFATSFFPSEIFTGGASLHLYFDQENQFMVVDKNTRIDGHVYFCVASGRVLHGNNSIEEHLEGGEDR